MENKEQFIFFGGGNMAQALIVGLLEYGISNSQITVIDPTQTVRNKLRNILKVGVVKKIDEEILSNKIIILAVKPNKISEVCKRIQTFHLQDSIIISIAAGTTLGKLSQLLPKANIIVCNAKHPCLVNKGVTVLISNQKRFRKLQETG